MEGKNDRKECIYICIYFFILKYWKLKYGYKFDYCVIIIFLVNLGKSDYIELNFDDILKLLFFKKKFVENR